MQLVNYDGTFQGFLTAVFDIYEHRFKDVEFTGRFSRQPALFGEVYDVQYDEEKVQRVLKGLELKISANAMRQLYRTFLSEIPGIESILLQYIRYVFNGKTTVEHDYSHAAVLRVQQVSKTVYREKHRMEAFVRFQLTKDELFYAVIEPDFDVLPLLQKHFADRYADQRWMIYDTRRKYGLYYDKQEISFVTLTFNEGMDDGRNIAGIYAENEELFQKLWLQYFNSVNIAARKNTKLHIAHMPKRYWKFLPEKSLQK